MSKQIKIPAELAKELNNDPKALELFGKMPPSYRKEFILLVADAKKPETRTRRAQKIVELMLNRDKGVVTKPLGDILEMQPSLKIAQLNAPKNIEGYPYGWAKSLEKNMDIIHIFSTQAGDLKNQLSICVSKLKKTGKLWISWPKRSSKIETDLNENIVRDMVLPTGLVDVKVCAVDQDWSGLKFVYRLKNRLV